MMLDLNSAMRLRTLAASSALALAVLMPAIAHGQATTSAAGSAASPPADADTGEIIVTALRRSESVLKVPAAISVVGGGDLKTVGVNTVTDLQNLIPGLNIGTGGFGINISIRGITSD